MFLSIDCKLIISGGEKIKTEMFINSHFRVLLNTQQVYEACLHRSNGFPFSHEVLLLV